MKFRVLYFALIVGLFFTNFVNGQTVCTWVGGDAGGVNNWDIDANWTTTVGGAPAAAAKPTNSSDVIIPNSITNYPVVGSGTCVAKDVTLNANGGTSNPLLTISSGLTLDIEGDFLMSGGTLTMASNAVFDVNGNWNDVAGSFAPGDGTVKLTASADQTISCGAANTFRNLEFSNDGVATNDRTALTDITVTRDLDIKNSTRFTIGAVTVSITSAFRTLDVEAGAKIRLNDNSSVLIATANMNCLGEITFTADGNLNLNGTNNTITTLTTGGFGTITYAKTTVQDIAAPTGAYNNLILDQNSTKTASGNLVVDGNLTFTNSATLDMDVLNNRTLDLEGGFTLNNGTFLSRTGTHNIAGNWNDDGGTFVGTGTIILDGAAQNITSGATNSFLNFETQGSGDKTAQSNLAVIGTFTVTAGTFKTGAFETQVTGKTTVTSTLDIDNANGIFDANGEFDANGGNVTFTNPGNLELGGVVTDLGTFTCGTGTSKYDLAGAQTIIQPGNPYFNLSLIGNTKTAADGTALNVDGDFLLDGCTFDPGNNNHNLAGNWNETNSAVFDPSEGTITFSGANSDETITTLTNLATSGVTDGDDNSFYLLVIDATDITTASEIEVDNITTINNLKKLTIGDFTADFAGTKQFNISGTLVLSDDNTKVVANGGFNAATGGAVTFTAGKTSILELYADSPNLGTFTSNDAGTVKYLKAGDQDIDGGADLTYHNLTIEGSGTKTVGTVLNVGNDIIINTSNTFDANANVVVGKDLTITTGTLDFASNSTFNLVGDFIMNGGTFTAVGSGAHELEGNWKETAGIFQAGAGTILMDGSASKDIETIAGNFFNNLTIGDGVDTKVVQTNTANSINVEATLTVAANGTFDVLASHSLTLEDAVVTGALTATASAGNIALIDFQTADNATLTVTGTLTLTGTGTTERNAKITSDNNSQIDFAITGTFSGTDFTIEDPDADGFNLTGTNLPTIVRGTFDNPADNGCLLNFVDQRNLPVSIDGCVFNNTSSATTPKNVKANDATADNTGDIVTFLNYSGVLANGATAEDNDDESGGATEGHIEWFNNIWYSNGNADPSDVNQWWNKDDASAPIIHPSAADFLNTEHEFRVQQSSNYIALADWTVAGTVVILGFADAVLDPGNFEINATGDVTIASPGKLEFTGTGTFDSDGNFIAADGALITFSAANSGTLQLATLDPKLGVAGGADFTIGIGTVEYDLGGAQNIWNVPYYNLTINGSGTKTTSAKLDLAGDLTITAGVLDIGTGDDDVDIGGNFSNSGSLTISGETVTFDGTGDKTSSAISNAAGNLVVNKTSSGKVTFGGTGSFNDITVTAGTLDIGAQTFTAAGVTDIDGTLNLGTGTFTADGEFDASGGTGAVTFTAGEAGTLLLKGTVTSLGTFTSNASGTVTYNGGSSQNLPGTPTYNNLTINNTSNVILTGSPQVDRTLDFTNGSLTTTANFKLTFGNSASVTNTTDTKHINGNCSKIFNNSGAVAEFNYPVGNGALLRPIKLIVPAGVSSTTFKVKYNHVRSDTMAAADLANGGGTDGSLNHISGWFDPSTQPPGGANTGGYHFDITRSSGSKNAQLFVEWSNADTWGTGGGTTSSLKFARYNATNWVNAGGTLGGLQQAISGTLTSDAISDFSNIKFTLASTDIGLFLPIDLVSFKGECVNNQTKIEFVVASQVNNEYFTIKRSKNNLEWEEVGFINGGGTNNEEITYTWTDYSPKSGVNYYKLFQTDIDGISKSFSPIAINCENKVEDYHIYPNPTNDRVSVEFDLEYYQGDDIQMVLKDFKGVIVKSNTIELQRGYNYFELDLSKLQNGFYVLSYSGTKNYIPSKRIVKL